MKRNLTFTLAGILAFGFSVLVLAQQPATNQTKPQPAQTEQKAVPMHKHHMKLNKDEITALQNALIQANVYKGKANGKLDKSTQEAIRQYQTANNLKVTGWPNKEMLDKLGVQYAKREHHKNTEPPSQQNPASAPQKPNQN